MRAFLIMALATLCWGTAQAADHALIMGIGNYQRPSANLPGIDRDVQLAENIARSIGVPAANIHRLLDDQVTVAGLAAALGRLEAGIAPGDRVFLYYSGHGSQVRGSGTQKCVEGMFLHDMRLYPDHELEPALQRLGRKASQLVMFNDSCFSGGAASTRSTRGLEQAVPKFYKGDGESGYTCGQAVNMRRALRGLADEAGQKGSNVIYIAAAREDQVAFATTSGSAATRAWERCLSEPAADSNGSGALDAKELQRCAQQFLNDWGFDQSITVEGNERLPLSLAAMPEQPQAGVSEPAQRSAATLEDIRQAASPAIRVELQAQQRLVIGQDPLDIQVRSNRDGYLYLLHVGSDGKTFNLLFPNQLDGENFLHAGQVLSLPRAHWRVRAAGPVGASQLMAIVSDQPRDFLALNHQEGPFRSAPLDSRLQRNLRVEATGIGSSGSSGLYGASAVLSISEVSH